MALLTLDQLFLPATPDAATQALLDASVKLGLDTTSWELGQPTRTILNALAQKESDADKIVSILNQAQFLDFAAAVTPEGGPGWLDLLGQSVYGTPRIPFTYASGTITFVNSSGLTYGPFLAGTFHIASTTTKVTYTNSASFTVPSGGSVNVTFSADLPGTAGTSSQGTITSQVTPLVGVTINNAAALVGANSETNAAYVGRCRAKLASTSPNGPQGAYDYFARTINGPTGVKVSSGSLIQPSSPINRTRVVTNYTTGVVTTYVASAVGAVAGDTNGIAKPIVSSTNATPIVMTVTGHGYSNGDVVFITSHLVNTAANGTWVVASSTTNTFALTGSVGNGVGGATGTSFRQSDLDLVDHSVQANAVPLATTAKTVSVANDNVSVIGVITVTGTNVNDTTIIANAIAAVLAMQPLLPIGGEGTSGKLYVDQIRGAVLVANIGTLGVTISSPASDVTLAANQIVNFSPTPSFTVVRV